VERRREGERSVWQERHIRVDDGFIPNRRQVEPLRAVIVCNSAAGRFMASMPFAAASENPGIIYSTLCVHL